MDFYIAWAGLEIMVVVLLLYWRPSTLRSLQWTPALDQGEAGHGVRQSGPQGHID